MPWKSPFEPNVIEPVSRTEFEKLAKRVDVLERLVKGLPTNADQTRWYHRDELPMENVQTYPSPSWLPWVSTATRFSERLTSVEFVKATAGQAGLAAVSFAILGTGAAAWWRLPWYTGLVIGGCSFAVIGVGLVLHNRGLLQQLVNGQVQKGSKRRAELRVQIDKPANHGVEFLYLNSNVTPEQLREFARAALAGSNLGVHKWTGEGALFTRGQYDDLMTELETMGYAFPARGPTARRLTAKGKALFRAVSE